MENNQISKPSISQETKREMAEFFMKTSIPRIIAQRKLQLPKKQAQ